MPPNDLFYNIVIGGMTLIFALVILAIAVAWIEFAFREWWADRGARRVQSVDVSAELAELERTSLGSDWP